MTSRGCEPCDARNLFSQSLHVAHERQQTRSSNKLWRCLEQTPQQDPTTARLVRCPIIQQTVEASGIFFFFPESGELLKFSNNKNSKHRLRRAYIRFLPAHPPPHTQSLSPPPSPPRSDSLHVALHHAVLV